LQSRAGRESLGRRNDIDLPEVRPAHNGATTGRDKSERAEITGNINQLTIQLHRWQLRLQTLNERKQQLEKELGGKNL